MDNNNNNINQQPQQPNNQPNSPPNNQPYNQPNNQPYNQPYPPNYNGPQLEPPLTLGNWIIIMLLMIIPCVNIILLFIWAFGHNVITSKKNYARAMLIFMAVGFVFSLIFSSIIFSMLNSITNMSYY